MNTHLLVAIALLLPALALSNNESNPQPETAEALTGLATTYKGDGKLQQAEALLLRVVATGERRSTPEDTQLAVSSNNLATVYYAEGRLEEAAALFRGVLSVWENSPRPELVIVLIPSRGRCRGQ